jgi:hypothetical protein
MCVGSEKGERVIGELPECPVCTSLAKEPTPKMIQEEIEMKKKVSFEK